MKNKKEEDKMLKSIHGTGKVEKNVRIKKGCRIVFYNIGGGLVLVKVTHDKWIEWSYNWQKSLDSWDDKTPLNIAFSHLTCRPIAYVMSQTAGLTNVKLVEEKENFLSYEVI